MKILQLLLVAGVLLLIPVTSTPAAEGISSAIIKVDGLSCPFCAYGLEKHLNKLAAVEALDINMRDGQVIVHFKQGGRVSDDELRNAVKKYGFTARSITRQ